MAAHHRRHPGIPSVLRRERPFSDDGQDDAVRGAAADTMGGSPNPGSTALRRRGWRRKLRASRVNIADSTAGQHEGAELDRADLMEELECGPGGLRYAGHGHRPVDISAHGGPTEPLSATTVGTSTERSPQQGARQAAGPPSCSGFVCLFVCLFTNICINCFELYLVTI